MVPDALIEINGQIEPTLSFRRSCRGGLYGHPEHDHGYSPAGT
jgi:succinate dehydrogenase/fumarate reductase-like Fe-S protein